MCRLQFTALIIKREQAVIDNLYYLRYIDRELKCLTELIPPRNSICTCEHGVRLQCNIPFTTDEQVGLKFTK